MTGCSLSSVPLSGEVAKGLTDPFGPQALSSALLAPALLPRQHRTLPTPTVARIDAQLLSELPAEIAPRSSTRPSTSAATTCTWNNRRSCTPS